MLVETLLSSSYILRVINYESIHVTQYIKDTVGAWPYLKNEVKPIIWLTMHVNSFFFFSVLSRDKLTFFIGLFENFRSSKYCDCIIFASYFFLVILIPWVISLYDFGFVSKLLSNLL